MASIGLNGKLREVQVDEDMPLLWVLRDELGLTGTKYGCGIGACGACTVLLDGKPTRSCQLPFSAAKGRNVTTIEGLAEFKEHPVIKAWTEEQVPQCGYCQSGQILSATALLSKIASPTDADIDFAMAGNLCRCGTYPRIRLAIHRAAALIQSGNISGLDHPESDSETQPA